MKVLYLHEPGKLQEQSSNDNKTDVILKYELKWFIRPLSQTHSPNASIGLKTVHVLSLYIVITFLSPLACKL
jgi:hypothetical protein